MNTFPYDSWEAALEAAEAAKAAGGPFVGAVSESGYFTWGPGGNFATVLITLIAIVISVYAAVMVTRRENALLTESAERLATKYNSPSTGMEG